MQPGALRPYERALADRGPLGLVDGRGQLHTLALHRWLGDLDAPDRSVGDHCVGQVLDIGCGPGRFTVGLPRRGIDALGIDISACAVAITARRGGRAVTCDVFDPGVELLGPAAGWGTALLVDGNVGIGGDPVALLRRVGGLVRPGGHLIVETAAGLPPGPGHPVVADLVVLDARFVDAAGIHPTRFPWALVGPASLLRCARAVGFRAVERWRSGGRDFVDLVRRS